MKRVELQDLTVDQLAERFRTIALDQYEAMELHDTAKLGRLFQQEVDVVAELMLRAGDQRRVLMSLYGHPNPQVRYAAASMTKDITPQEARRVCEIIIERNEYPQTVNAGILIDALDRGPADLSWVLDRASRNRPKT